MEDANFYSNDTDASLVFIPHEDTFDFQSAKVVMFNRGDESLVERDMVVTTEEGRKVASYEMPDEIISHWGEWTAQPVFISGGEIYSGSIVPFSVIRYLMHERPPKLSEIVSVTKFLEQTQQAFDEMAENETERVLAEAQRQTSVSEAISTLDATNQNVEQTETLRASAESTRVSAEEQRKTDHANRSAELDGKADKVVIDNLAKMDVGLVSTHGEATYADGEITYEITTPSGSARVEFAIDAVAGDVYYGYFEVYAKFSNISRFQLGGIAGVGQIPKVNEWHTISDVLKSDTPGRPRFLHSTIPNYNIGDKVKYRHMMAINLTQTFGAGNEPTKEEMDRLIGITGYIDGEYALNNKEMIEFLRNDIRSKADKVTIRNMIANSGFDDGLWQWNVHAQISDTVKVIDGKLHVYAQNSEGTIYPSVSQASTSVVGHINYFRVEVSEMASNSVHFTLQDRNRGVISVSGNGVYSAIRTIDSGQTLTYLYLNHTIPTGSVVDYKIDNIMSLDLTETFGAGNEPTKEEMDELTNTIGHIDGRHILNNKEMLMWTLALIRRNKNAIVALGGV